MEIRRETTAELANRISNAPGVVGNVSYDGRVIDWTPAIDTCVVLSNGEDAVQVYEQMEPRIWQVMTVFGPTCRGKRALEAARAMKEWILPYVDTVFGSVPDRLPQAKWFYRQLGGKPVDAVETAHNVYTANPGETLYEFRAK